MGDQRRMWADVNTAVLKADLMDHIRQAEAERLLRKAEEEARKQQQQSNTKQS